MISNCSGPRLARLLLPAIAIFIIFTVAICLLPFRTAAQTVNAPKVTVDFGGGETQEMSMALQIMFLLTVLSLAPSILIMVTSFTRIVIVLSFVRNALGTQQVPPNQVLIGIALFLTVFIMAPTWNEINSQAIQPALAGQISQQAAIERGIVPLRDFMLSQTDEKDIALFISLGKLPRPSGPDDVPIHVLIPAFVLGELKKAFQMGFVIYLPFLVIDIVVASTLMSMGMMMLPPVMISLPFKILLFVLVDGWELVVKSLVKSFMG